MTISKLEDEFKRYVESLGLKVTGYQREISDDPDTHYVAWSYLLSTDDRNPQFWSRDIQYEFCEFMSTMRPYFLSKCAYLGGGSYGFIALFTKLDERSVAYARLDSRTKWQGEVWERCSRLADS